MTGSGSIQKYVAFGVMALFGLVGGLFVAGSAFEDPGGWAAVGLTASWVVPVAALSVLAVRRPTRAVPVFVVVMAVVVPFTLADAAFRIIPRDDWGPVTAILVFAVGVALASLGLHRPTPAGRMMVLLALAQLAAGVLTFVVHRSDDLGGRPPLAALLGGSSGVMIMPTLLVGLLFLLAGSSEAGTPAHPDRPVETTGPLPPA